jgi:hypothetical protein
MVLSEEQRPFLVFDMDSFLVDVSDSYRVTIAATVRHFTGKAISLRIIQQHKDAGGGITIGCFRSG